MTPRIVDSPLFPSTMTVPFPFDIVVVTSPDSKAAHAAESGPLASIASSLQGEGVRVISTSDPMGVRCGSGGGTLAALDLADSLFAGTRKQKPSVLIVHAGGKSSRCPTQMALGKAWTSLPLLLSKQTDDSVVKPVTTIGNPTSMLVQALGALFQNIPQGTVVAAASDVLLTLGPTITDYQTQLDWVKEEAENGAVIGLAVPAPLNTATNHGVFVLDKNETDGNISVQAVKRFLQKPSIDLMRQTSSCTFCQQEEKEESAWIDTGVVAFLPKSATALRNLASGLLKCCTERGLKDMYSQQQLQQDDPSEAEKLKDFCRRKALRVELYSHLMLALSTSKSDGLKTYLSSSQCGDLDSKVLSGIYSALSPYELKTCIIPAGQFIHLGTTRELVDFMTYGVSWKHESPDGSTIFERQCRGFGRRIGLVRRSGSYMALPTKSGGHGVDEGCVVLNSMLVCTNDGVSGNGKNYQGCTIGNGTVIEHASLNCPAGIRIGSDCLVSGVRGHCSDAIGPLEIPDGMCLQMLPLKQRNGNTIDEYVYMYFGVNDEIKKCKTLYGMDVEDVLERSGIPAHHIWDETIDVNARTLWNARLHPIVATKRCEDDQKIAREHVEFIHGPLFSWITTLRECHPHASLREDAIRSLDTWTNLQRLSLSDIQEMADAYEEFQYRNGLAANVIPTMKGRHYEEMSELLLQRQHKECNWDFAVDNFAANGETGDFINLLATLDDVIRVGLTQAKYDVTSRAFMVMSMLLRDMGNMAKLAEWNTTVATSHNDQSSEDEDFASDVNALSFWSATATQRLTACTRLLSRRDRVLSVESAWSSPSSSAFMKCSTHTEHAALALIELCVSGSGSCGLDKFTHRTALMAPLDSWVVSSAPARIDLAGGWSDTPPLSYEFGGAVLNVAVTLDGCKPLSSRCRIVSSGNGIHLRTESRDFAGKLLSRKEVVVHKVCDLADYHDPTGDCALLKCALVLFGLVPPSDMASCQGANLQPYINAFCSSETDVGLEIVSTSLLPHGSGLGTSSILGGCVLAAIGKCIGVDILGAGYDERLGDDDRLIQAVLTLEQLLSTGGGWQDQVGGLIEGAKLGTSKTQVLPLHTRVQRIPLEPRVRAKLEERLVLVHTGQTRLAKHILQNVLRRWARRSTDEVMTVNGLVTGARMAANALQQGDLDQLGQCLNTYWYQKKMMAGEDSGVEPPVVREILTELLDRQLIVGGSLCGAGGGGFMVLLLREGQTCTQLREIVENDKKIEHFVWHECRVSEEGLTVRVENGTGENGSALDSFDRSWHD